MSKWNPLAVLAVVGHATCLFAAPALSQAVGPDTANAVSLDPEAPNSYRNFAPELAQTVARMPQIDPASGLHVKEVKPNLFYVTDGIYQSAFVRTGQGIIVIDAPPSFARKLPAVIEQRAAGEPVKYLLYSHSHMDHVGGSHAFAAVAGLRIVAPQAVAAALKAEANEAILAPNVTFADQHAFTLGRERVEIRTAHFHSEDTDAIIYLPRQKLVVAVDTITPGEVPFMNFGATSRYGGYVAVFDELLRYDFDTILSGHVSILGTRQDVVINRDYVHDVRDTVAKGMQSFFPKYEQAFAVLDRKNGNLAYRIAMEQVRRECANEIIDRWKDKLSVVDVWADSHCETVILHSIMH